VLLACRLLEAHATYVLFKMHGGVGEEVAKVLCAGRARIAAMLDQREMAKLSGKVRAMSG
jgi:hypothetical protein